MYNCIKDYFTVRPECVSYTSKKQWDLSKRTKTIKKLYKISNIKLNLKLLIKILCIVIHLYVPIENIQYKLLKWQVKYLIYSKSALQQQWNWKFNKMNCVRLTLLGKKINIISLLTGWGGNGLYIFFHALSHLLWIFFFWGRI